MEQLTETQKHKWTNFLISYPDFCAEKEILLTTSELGKALQCRPDHVCRQLIYISRGLEHRLRFQKMTSDSRNKVYKADHLDLRNMKGGRQRGCSKEKGIKGKSILLRVWFEK
jgi:hypothetical protein